MICGSVRMSKERENSKLDVSTLHVSPILLLNLQGKLLIDRDARPEGRVGRSNIVDTIIQRNAEERLLFWERYLQIFDTEHFQSVKLDRLTHP